jgi:FkbM family methyltransferase
MLGYSVSFLDEGNFRYLVDEVFFDMSYMFSATTDSPRIVDCGSNIGLSVLFFKYLFPKAKITAFEPDPDTFGILSKNIEQNFLHEVTVHCCALTDYDGMIEFYKPSDRRGDPRMSVHNERMSGTTISVPTKRLVPFLREPIDLLKMDIEGAEECVLNDLYRSGVFPNVMQIHLEYHHHIHQQKDALSGVLQILETSDFGYQIRADQRPWPIRRGFQDVSLYVYKKSAADLQ